ncbi:MAG: hypothetical protein WAN11_02770 [Syntrophobacteraceae bacterium]
MALPLEHRTPRLEMLQAIVDSTPPEKLFNFPPLEPSDFQIVGMFIQLYNYMELNLRRSIEAFAQAKLLQGDAAKKYPVIHSSEVSATVQNSVKVMDKAIENIPETLRILEIIERRREIRNLLGHWAARRIPNENVIVLVTKDEKDAKRIGGIYLCSGHVKNAILDLVDIRELIKNELIPFEMWLAQKTSEWRKRYVGD